MENKGKLILIKGVVEKRLMDAIEADDNNRLRIKFVLDRAFNKQGCIVLV